MRSHRSVLLGSGLVAALVVTGCADETRQRARVPEAPTKDTAAEAEVPEENVPAGSLARSRVDAVLRKGPPWLLAHVEVEEVLRKGTFIGWRVVSMPAGWEGSGIKPGDVVTRVNGLGLEKPDDFFSAWTAVAGSKEIRVAYERDGKAEEVAMPIVGEPSADTKLALEQEPAPGAANKPKAGALPGPHETRVISNGEDAW
jgi:hypothetical protein